MQIDLTLDTVRPWWLWLLVMALVALVLWTYRRTWPPVRTRYRLLLLALRLTVVLVAAALLFDPLVGITRSRERLERVAVLVDRSASMLLPLSGQGGPQSVSRLQHAVSLLDSAATAQDSLVRLFGFGGPVAEFTRPSQIPASPADRTDLASALAVLTAPGAPAWDRVYILSDGAVNSGEDPLRYSGALPPVESLVLGQPLSRPDLAFAALRQTRPAYVGENVELELSVGISLPGSEGLPPGQSLAVDFYDGDGKIKEATLAVGAAGARFLGANVELPALSEGRHLVRAFLRPLPGEWTALNNERLLIVDVARSRQRMLLVTNYADWDFTFLHRALARRENWDISCLVLLGGDQKGVLRREDSKGHFSEGHLPTAAELDDLELVALHGDLGRFDPAFLRRLAARADQGGLALVFWPLAALDTRVLPAALARYLPFDSLAVRLDPVGATDIPCQLRTAGRYGILDGLAAGPAESVLPPVEWSFRPLTLAPGSEVLATVSGSSGSLPGDIHGAPLLVARPLGGSRSAVALGGGLWHWHMLSRGNERSDDARYERLWENLGDWLIAGRRSGGGLDLHPVKEVFALGESVQFEGSAGSVDTLARLHLFVTRADSATVDTLMKDLAPSEAGGRLSADLGGLTPGLYRYRAAQVRAGKSTAAEGNFAVESWSPEMAEVGPDTTILAGLARATHGSLTGERELTNRLKSGRAMEPETRRIRLSANPWLYLLLIALLAAEWALRRRKSMP